MTCAVCGTQGKVPIIRYVWGEWITVGWRDCPRCRGGA
jgi:hypothetical protein